MHLPWTSDQLGALDSLRVMPCDRLQLLPSQSIGGPSEPPAALCVMAHGDNEGDRSHCGRGGLWILEDPSCQAQSIIRNSHARDDKAVLERARGFTPV